MPLPLYSFFAHLQLIPANSNQSSDLSERLARVSLSRLKEGRENGFLNRGLEAQVYPYFSLGVAGMIPTARVERAHSYRARSASKGIVPATPSLTS